MSLIAEKELELLGMTAGCTDRDHDLVHELSRRLDSIWRMDQYFANAEGQDEIQAFWVKIKLQEQENIDELKQLLTKEIQRDKF